MLKSAWWKSLEVAVSFIYEKYSWVMNVIYKLILCTEDWLFLHKYMQNMMVKSKENWQGFSNRIFSKAMGSTVWHIFKRPVELSTYEGWI